MTADVWSGMREQALQKAKKIDEQYAKKLSEHKVITTAVEE